MNGKEHQSERRSLPVITTMDPRMQMRKKNSSSVCPLHLLITTFPYFIRPRPVSGDSEYTFDPEPPMTSLPKLVLPSLFQAGGNVSTSKESKDLEPLHTSRNLLQENRTSIWKPVNTAASPPALADVEPPADTSSFVVQHGQATPPNSESPTSAEASEAVKQTRRKRKPLHKTHQIETDVEAVSVLSIYAAPASNLGLNLITVGGRRTRKRAKWGNQRLIFSEEKRKPCLEKNRIAADHCRTNKKRREEQLQIRSHELFSVQLVAQGDCIVHD